MKPLAWDLLQVLRRNRDGSHATQYERKRMVMQFAHDVHRLGFKGLRLRNVSQKHVLKVIECWRRGEHQPPVSDATLMNRLAALRWALEKVGKSRVLPETNRALGLESRRPIPSVSKALTLTEKALNKVTDAHIRQSLRLQAVFGLRRSEAMKIHPQWADRGDRLLLKASWTKGGRPREVPIRTQEQRQVLEVAKVLAGNGSLIPNHKSYRQHLATWEYQTRRAGLSKTHGLRHAYAQARYQELTGRKPPILGGMPSQALTGEQKAQDREARLQIAAELGHSRVSITNVYLGV